MVSVLFENPGNEFNVSAMMRTCEFFGVPFYSTTPYVPSHKVDRGVGRMRVRKGLEPMPVLDPATWKGRLIVTDSLFSKHPLDVDWREDDLVVFGNEFDGVSPKINRRAAEWVGIPRKGKMACLNVNAAASALLMAIDCKRLLALVEAKNRGR
jgi:tRNA G18 (ribose-2'-O)-methylase SpoU